MNKREMLLDYLKSEIETLETLNECSIAASSEIYKMILKEDIESHEQNVKNLNELIEMVDNQLEVYATISCERNGIAIEHKVLTDGSRLFTEDEWEKECEARSKSYETLHELICTVRDCIALLRVDGKNTKKVVLELLEEVIEK